MHILEQWDFNDVKSMAERANGQLHRLDSLRCDVDSLECADRQTGACIDELRATCEALLTRIEQLERQVEDLKEKGDRGD